MLGVYSVYIMAGFVGNKAFLGKPVGDEWFKQEYKKDEFYNHSNDIIDQCLTNIGLASDIINENQRSQSQSIQPAINIILKTEECTEDTYAEIIHLRD